MTINDLLLTPEWPAPSTVQAYTTLCGENAHFDLRQQSNRQHLKKLAGLPAEPAWLKQTHSTKAVRAHTDDTADASYTDKPGHVCVVLTADCLPVLLCHRDGSRVAAIHAGWRGLAAGILQETLRVGTFSPKDTLVWMGPAIGPCHFEVGPEVRDQFLATWPKCAHAFRPSTEGRWMADLYALATHQLNHLGIEQISGGNRCTYAEEKQFFSYRREKEAGRMATLIWMV